MPEAMDRRTFVGTMAAAAVAARAQTARRPNIIVIYADDLDYDELNCFQDPQYPSPSGAQERGYGDFAAYAEHRMLTPHIDGLARDGAKLERFYITSPVCTPSRYSLLSGRYATRCPQFRQAHPDGGPAMIQWNTPLDPSEATLPKAMQRLGYRTGMVGKWHNNAPGSAAKGIKSGDDPTAPEVARKIREAHDTGCAYLRETQGFDYADRIYFNNKEALVIPESLKCHNLEWFAEGAREFIGSSGDQPFFLYVPLTTPHGRYQPAMMQGNPLATPRELLKTPPVGMPSRESVKQRVKEAGLPPRQAVATWIDDLVGSLLAKLDETGQRDNTIVVFTSDHQSRGKYTCYESARVPCIICWPRGIKPGTVVPEVTANIDLAATLTELAGGGLPAEHLTDGLSFAGNLTGWGERVGDDRAVLLEMICTRAAVTPRWKYLANRPNDKVKAAMAADAVAAQREGRRRNVSWDGTPNPHPNEKGIRYGSDLHFPHYFDADQLYDLQADPYEHVNLAASQPAALAAMQDKLRWLLAPLPHTFGEFKT